MEVWNLAINNNLECSSDCQLAVENLLTETILIIIPSGRKCTCLYSAGSDSKATQSVHSIWRSHCIYRNMYAATIGCAIGQHGDAIFLYTNSCTFGGVTVY